MNKRLFWMIPTLMLLAASVGDAFAGGRRQGTAGMTELLIPMGARNIAIGGANVANVLGTEAMYYNPAGLAGLSGIEVGMHYMTYFADMNVSYLALGSKIGSLGTIGFGLQVMDVGEISVTTMDNPEGTGEMLNPNFLTLTGSFSRSFTDRIRFGVNAKLISERIGNMSASALAFDFGIQYKSPFGVELGVVMKNYGTGLQYNGTGNEFDSGIPYANPNATTRKTKLDMATHELPASLGLGVGYQRKLSEWHSINVTGLYSNNSYINDQMLLGVEYSLKDRVFLRGGYSLALYPGNLSADAKESQYGLTLGFGLNLPLGGRKVSFDYAYRSMELFDANQCFGITIGF